MRDILEPILITGDVIGQDARGRTILAVAVENWLLDELAEFGTDLEDIEPELGDVVAANSPAHPFEPAQGPRRDASQLGRDAICLSSLSGRCRWGGRSRGQRSLADFHAQNPAKASARSAAPVQGGERLSHGDPVDRPAMVHGGKTCAQRLRQRLPAGHFGIRRRRTDDGLSAPVRIANQDRAFVEPDPCVA